MLNGKSGDGVVDDGVMMGNRRGVRCCGLCLLAAPRRSTRMLGKKTSKKKNVARGERSMARCVEGRLFFQETARKPEERLAFGPGTSFEEGRD